MEKLELEDFKFKDKFVGLTDLQLQNALQMVNAQFSGVYKLWALVPPPEARAKRELCINYLVGWQLAELYPDSVVGIGTSGAMPLKSKKAGPVSLTYRDTIRQGGAGVLDLLTTNTFGLLALQMIQSAPEQYMLYA